MRTLISTAVGILCLSACQSTDPLSNASASREPQSSPSWKLRLISVCENTAPEECAGGYGFSVSADGMFQVGPGPRGETARDRLSPEQFSELESALALYLSGVDETISIQSIDETCQPHVRRGSDDTLTLMRESSEIPVYRQDGFDFCVQRGDFEHAEKLSLVLRKLADFHYPLPFPDAWTPAQ